VPNWFQAVLLALAAWRTWHLVALDDITDRQRRYVTDGRDKLLDFIECPYCLGFWFALGWVGFFAAWGTGATWAALPFALNTVVIALNHWLSSE